MTHHLSHHHQICFKYSCSANKSAINDYHHFNIWSVIEPYGEGGAHRCDFCGHCFTCVVWCYKTEMPSLDFVTPLDNSNSNMMLDYQHPETHMDLNQNYHQTSPTTSPRYTIPSPEYPESYNNSSTGHSPLHQPTTTHESSSDMYRHPSPVGSYHHSMNSSPFNNYAGTAAASQHQHAQFSPSDYIPQFHQHPSGAVSATATATSNLQSSCAETSAAAVQHQPHSPVPTWPLGSPTSAITGYPTSPATGTSDWSGYQSSDPFSSNNINSTCSTTPFFTGAATATACAMGAGAIPTFDDFTTGYPTVPTQMFTSQGMAQQGMIGLERQIRCSSAYEWAKAANTYRVNPHTGKFYFSGTGLFTNFYTNVNIFIF